MGALSPKRASTTFRLNSLSPNSIIVTRAIVESVLRAVGIGPARFVGRFGVVGPVPLGLEPNGCEPPGVCVGCDDDRVSSFSSSMAAAGGEGGGRRRESSGRDNFNDSRERRGKEAVRNQEARYYEESVLFLS